MAVLARIGASCADDGTAVIRSLVPNFPFAETDPVVCAEVLGAQSRIVEAHQFHPIVDTEPGGSRSRPALRHPHFCLLQARFGSGPAGRTLTGSGPGRGK